MTGTIKNFLPQNQYGFIIGDDGKDYFFHQSSLITSSQSSQIFEGALVEFDPSVAPKGYKANRVTIKSRAEAVKYVVPVGIIISKQDSVNGWEVLEESNWVITASASCSLDNVKAELKNMARIAGANGVTYVSYSKSTGSSGNYNFTIHNFTGRPVALGKRSLSGKYDLRDITIVNATAELYKNKCTEKYATLKSDYKFRIFAGLAISTIITLVTKGSGWFVGVLIMLIVFIYNRPALEGGWLRKG